MTIKMYDLVGSDKARPFSPHCWKARMAIAHKGLECETIPVTFTEIVNIENGGFNKVPVINHGGKLIEDSYEIALYLGETYPDTDGRLFKGGGARSITRFVEAWTHTQFYPWISKWAMLDIHNMLDEKDQIYFRQSREKRFGKSLEEVVVDREQRIGDLTNLLTPLRVMLTRQEFIGGDEPLFADYIVFGGFQWMRICSGLNMIPKDESVLDWVNRMLDLHDGLAHAVSEANL